MLGSQSACVSVTPPCPCVYPANLQFPSFPFPPPGQAHTFSCDISLDSRWDMTKTIKPWLWGGWFCDPDCQKGNKTEGCQKLCTKTKQNNNNTLSPTRFVFKIKRHNFAINFPWCLFWDRAAKRFFIYTTPSELPLCSRWLVFYYWQMKGSRLSLWGDRAERVGEREGKKLGIAPKLLLLLLLLSTIKEVQMNRRRLAAQEERLRLQKAEGRQKERKSMQTLWSKKG